MVCYPRAKPEPNKAHSGFTWCLLNLTLKHKPNRVYTNAEQFAFSWNANAVYLDQEGEMDPAKHPQNWKSQTIYFWGGG